LEGGDSDAVTYLVRTTKDPQGDAPPEIEVGSNRKKINFLILSLTDTTPPFYIGARYAEGAFVWREIEPKVLPCTATTDFRFVIETQSSLVMSEASDSQSTTLNIWMPPSTFSLDPNAFFSWSGECLPSVV